MQERIQNDDRAHGDNGGRHLKAFLRRVYVDRSAGRELAQCSDLRLNLEEEHLQRVVLLIIHEHNCIEVVVPVTDGIEQSDRSQNRHAKREVNAECNLHFARAVNLCGFVQLGRDTAHKVAHKEHIKGIEQQARYDECPDVIVAVQCFTHHVPRNKARRENHGDVEVKGQTVSVTAGTVCKGVACAECDERRNDGTDNRCNRRYQVGLRNG